MSKTKNQASRVSFLGFFKLNFLYGLALGQLAGLWFLGLGICRLPVHLNLGSWNIEGLPAGIGAFILLPPAFGIMSLVVAPVMFLPFTLACRVFGGFKVAQ
jgi:hypothetical protein